MLTIKIKLLNIKTKPKTTIEYEPKSFKGDSNISESIKQTNINIKINTIEIVSSS